MSLRTESGESPTHLVAAAGDRKALCGEKDALPVMAARWVDAHRAGRARRGKTLELCSVCEAVLRVPSDLTRTVEVGVS